MSMNLSTAVELGQLVCKAYEYFDFQRMQPAEDWSLPEGFTFLTILNAPALQDMRDNSFGFLAEKENNLYIIFRGTESKNPIEFLADLNAEQHNIDFLGGIHGGFYQIYKNCKDEIHLALSQQAYKTIYIAGHSLGGALASICLKDLYSTWATAQPNRSLIGYTYASPRVFSPEAAGDFRKFENVEFWRIFNTEDLVPMFPFSICPTQVPLVKIHSKNSLLNSITQMLIDKAHKLTSAHYQHVGKPYALNFVGTSFVDNHSLVEYLNQLML